MFVVKNSDATSWHKLLHHYDRFAPSFVTQPNGPQCTKIVRNAPKHEFRIQWGGSRALVAKNFGPTSYHELLYQFGPFCTEFQKSTKWSQMHQNCMNAPNHEFRVQWGGSRALVAKNSDATLWHELLHQFGPFCTEFRKATNRCKMHQILRNAPKLEFSVQWGGSRALVAKHSATTLWHKLLHQFGRFAPSFVTQPNGPQCPKIIRNAPKHEFRVQWGGSVAFITKNSDATSWHELLH